jgi:hypothetical protein
MFAGAFGKIRLMTPDSLFQNPSEFLNSASMNAGGRKSKLFLVRGVAI